MIADDRRRSQKIEHGSIFCDRLRSSAITIAGSQAIAEVCFHMIADDRRTFCDLRSAIRDRLRSYGNQPRVLSITYIENFFQWTEIVTLAQILQFCIYALIEEQFCFLLQEWLIPIRGSNHSITKDSRNTAF